MAITSQLLEAGGLILGLIIPIVGSIFHFMMVAMVTDVGSLPENRYMAITSQLLRLEV